MLQSYICYNSQGSIRCDVRGQWRNWRMVLRQVSIQISSACPGFAVHACRFVFSDSVGGCEDFLYVVFIYYINWVNLFVTVIFKIGFKTLSKNRDQFKIFLFVEVLNGEKHASTFHAHACASVHFTRKLTTTSTVITSWQQEGYLLIVHARTHTRTRLLSFFGSLETKARLYLVSIKS